MNDCLFCKICAGEIPSQKVYEDECAYAFRDINPQAPVHILVVPKAHLANVLECDAQLAGRLMETAGKIAQSEGLAESGFRLVTNCGGDGCQSVNHFHIHILGGRKLTEKMA